MTRKAVLSAVLAVVIGTAMLATPVAAVESTALDAPAESEVGTDVEATYEVTDLFTDFESWTLVGETDVTSVTWTVTQYDQAGNQVAQESYDGQQFSQGVDIESGVSRIEVRVTGTTPSFDTPTYDPPQQFTAARFTLERDGGTQQAIAAYEVHHYTQDSRDVRGEIDDAQAVVDSSGGEQSRDTLDSAVSAFNAGNYDNANQLANRAENEAQRNARTESTLIYGAAAILLIVVVVSGYFVYRSRQQGPSRLR